MSSEKSRRFMTEVRLYDAEKRYRPSKHYVFIIQVGWSDGSEYVIYRKYSDFYDFHVKLIDLFPVEAGVGDTHSRSLPFLPGRKVFQRSEVKKVASKRQVELAEYCQKILRLEKVSQSQHVTEFFLARDTDIRPPQDARVKAQRSSLLAALLPFLDNRKDQTDGGVERSSSFGSESQIEAGAMRVSGPIISVSYRAIADFKATKKNEVSLQATQKVDVVEKCENGWWFVQGEDGQGWAPASFLEPASTELEVDEPEPLAQFKRYMTTSDYKAQLQDEVSFARGATVDVMHKLLDGWWIVQYDGEVGFAPATYLTPYKNPHLKPSPTQTPTMNRVTMHPSPKPIPQRRCTIKQSRSKWNKQTPGRDLSAYRKRSVKMNALRRKQEDIMSQEKHVPAVSLVIEADSEEEEDYENQEVIDALSKHMKKTLPLKPTENTTGLAPQKPEATKLAAKAAQAHTTPAIIVPTRGIDQLPTKPEADSKSSNITTQVSQQRSDDADDDVVDDVDGDDSYENVEEELMLAQQREHRMSYTSLVDDNSTAPAQSNAHAQAEGSDEEDYDDVASFHDYINVNPTAPQNNGHNACAQPPRSMPLKSNGDTNYLNMNGTKIPPKVSPKPKRGITAKIAQFNTTKS